MGVRNADELADIARDYGLDEVTYDAGLHAAEIKAPATALQHLASSVTSDQRLRYVEPPIEVHLDHERNDPDPYMVDPGTGVPYQWWFTQIGVDRALNLSSGNPSMLVGVVDSGIVAVPDLAGKVAESWYDQGLTSDAVDRAGHGTFVGSIIAANNDDGMGIAGSCGSCRIVAVKAFPDGSESTTDLALANGIRFISGRGIRVLNLSNGSPAICGSHVEYDAISYAIQQGILVVASSGNDGAGAVSCPAAWLQPSGGGPSAGLAVGASDHAGNRATFSNYGANLSLVAPGTYNSAPCEPDGIFAAIPSASVSLLCSNYYSDETTGALYTYSNGTSFSAPMVAGVAALLWAIRPDLGAAQIADLLKRSASIGQWTPDRGWGVLDAARALELATGRSSADPPPAAPPEGGPPATDSMQPTARALAGTYRPGAISRLSFRLRDNSGEARVYDTIYNAKSRKLGQVRSAFTKGANGVVFYVTWRAPRSAAGTLEHCVVAWDRAGNSSNESCARLRRH